MRNILVAALSLIVFETFGALPAGTVLKFENPDQMIHYIKMQTREVDRLRPGVPQAIVAGIKDYELEKQKQFRDCLNYFSALPSEQCQRFYAGEKEKTNGWHMDYPVSPTLMEIAGEIKKLLGELPKLLEQSDKQVKKNEEKENTDEQVEKDEGRDPAVSRKKNPDICTIV